MYSEDPPGSELGHTDKDCLGYIEQMQAIAGPVSWRALCWILTNTGNGAPPGWRHLCHRLRRRVRHPCPLWRLRLALRRMGVTLDQDPAAGPVRT